MTVFGSHPGRTEVEKQESMDTLEIMMMGMVKLEVMCIVRELERACGIN